MSDESVVLNDITRFGLRRMHVVRMGERVEREGWIERVPAEGRAFLQVWEQHEADVDVWHLWLWWNAREMVMLPPPSLPQNGRAVLGEGHVAGFWWIGCMPVRLAVDCAATMFRMAMGRWPGAALVRYLPVGVEDGTMIQLTSTPSLPSPCEGEGIPLRAAGWVPGKYVVVVQDGGSL